MQLRNFFVDVRHFRGAQQPVRGESARKPRVAADAAKVKCRKNERIEKRGRSSSRSFFAVLWLLFSRLHCAPRRPCAAAVYMRAKAGGRCRNRKQRGRRSGRLQGGARSRKETSHGRRPRRRPTLPLPPRRCGMTAARLLPRTCACTYVYMRICAQKLSPLSGMAAASLKNCLSVCPPHTRTLRVR